MKIAKIVFLLGLVPGVYYLMDSIFAPKFPTVVATLNQPAHDFSLAQFQLKSLSGKPILLHFWATWCAPCIYELPELLALARARKDIEIVAISVDRNWGAEESFFRAHPELSDLRKEGKVLHDPNEIAAGLYQANRFPESILINRKFLIDNKFIGPQLWNSREMKGILDRLSR